MATDCEHTWRTITVECKAHPSIPDRAHQECTECGRFRTKKNLGWVGEDEDE